MKTLQILVDNDVDYDFLRIFLNRIQINYKEIQNPSEKINEIKTINTKNANQFQHIDFSEKTLSATINAIEIIQKNYFKSEKSRHIVPMSLEDIAKLIGKDVSTISRILDDKSYCMNDKKLFYKELFSQHDFSTFNGRPVSRFEILEEIEKLILNENKSKPLSDEEIKVELVKLNYNIETRTVNKYRNEFLKVKKSNLRRL